MRSGLRLVFWAMMMVAQASCNAILGLDSVQPTDDALVDGTPDGIPDGTPDAPPDAPSLTPPVITTPSGLITNQSQPLIAGTCMHGADVSVLMKGDPFMETWCTVTCSASDTFACAPADEQADGTYIVVAIQKVGDGTSDPSASIDITINTTADPPATITAPAGNSIINGNPTTVAGACTSGQTVTVKENGAPVCGPVTCAGGSYHCTDIFFTGGPHTLVAEQSDTIATSSVAFFVDNVAPGAPTITSPSGPVIINATTLLVSGTCETGAAVTVSDSGAAPMCTATCAEGGYSCTLTPLTNGTTYQMIATQADAVGNLGPASSTRSVTVDTTAPVAPVITAPAAGSTICSTTPTVTGSCETGAQVSVYKVANGTETALCTNVACTSNVFSCAPTIAPPGSVSIRARQRDTANNTSSNSDLRTFTVSSSTLDYDFDTVPDSCDNCPHIANQFQENGGDALEPDGLGDACDASTGQQSIIKFYPINTSITEFTGDAWINDNMTVNPDLGHLKRSSTNVGAISKMVPGGVGEVIMGASVGINDSDAASIQLSNTHDMSVSASCKVQYVAPDGWLLKYLVNGSEADAIPANGEEFILRQQLLDDGSHQDVCSAGTIRLHGGVTMTSLNATYVVIRLFDDTSYIDYVLLVRHD